VHTTEAVAFSIAAQALVVVSGAAVILLISAWHVAKSATRLRRSRNLVAAV
jgi:hypothetical protein